MSFDQENDFDGVVDVDEVESSQRSGPRKKKKKSASPYYTDANGNKKLMKLRDMNPAQVNAYQQILEDQWVKWLVLSIIFCNAIGLILLIVARCSDSDSYKYCNYFEIAKTLFYVSLGLIVAFLCCYFGAWGGIMFSLSRMFS